MDIGEIGIVETRNILRLVNDLYQCDLGEYALISLKRRIEDCMQIHSIRYADNLITKLREDAAFFDIFLHDISVDSTEMFRDPSLWRIMRDDYLPKLVKPGLKFKIWLPSNVSGDELYTLLIVLKESGLSEYVDITASYLSDMSMQHMKSGVLLSKKLEVSEENYKRYQGKFTLDSYYSMQGDKAIKNLNQVNEVHFVKQNWNFENAPKGFDLIIFRNQMIYYNMGLEEKMFNLFWDSLNPSGLLVIGIKENGPQNSVKVFRAFNETERIYQKK